jgi:blocked-early-in-transport protein 1
MSEAYERERQNNARLDELSNKVSALRGITVDIYDNARAQDVIDDTSNTFSSMTSQMKGSAGRLTRMAQSGNKIAILKLSAIIIGVFIVLYYTLKLIFGFWKMQKHKPPSTSSALGLGRNNVSVIRRYEALSHIPLSIDIWWN